MEDINIKDLEVRKEIACGDIIIKLYTPPVKQRYNRNITGENIDGEILWQIEDVRPNVDSPFMNIILYDEKKIEAYNWEGVFYYVHETKNIANKHLFRLTAASCKPLSAHKKNEYENRIRKLPKKSYSQRF